MLLSTGFLLSVVLYGLAAGQNCDPGCVKQFDADGKQTCNCCQKTAKPTDPCANHNCGNGQTCVAKEAACNNAFGLHCQHTMVPECQVTCPTQKCASGCIEVVDGNGCRNCWCNQGSSKPCEGYTGCNPDQECYVECSDVQNCDPIALCRKKCESVTCPAGCSQYTDTEGCPACSCCNSCLSHTCAANEECVLETQPGVSGSVVVPTCKSKTG